MSLEDYPSEKRMSAIRRLARALGKSIEEKDLPRNELEARQIQWDLLQQLRARTTKKMIDKSKIRGELIRLKTDVEGIFNSSSEFLKWGEVQEEFHREAVEDTMAAMERCDMKYVLENLGNVDTGQALLTRIFAKHQPGHSVRLPNIKDMLIDTLVEIADNNCKCEFKEEE